MAGCICIPYIYNWQIKNKKKTSSEVGTAGTSINKSLAGEGKIRKSFKPHIRNNYGQRYKSLVVQGDKHTEGGPSSPLCVRVRGPAQPYLLKGMMVGQSVPWGVLWEGHIHRTAPKTCFVSPNRLLGTQWAVSCNAHDTHGPGPSRWPQSDFKGTGKGKKCLWLRRSLIAPQ